MNRKHSLALFHRHPLSSYSTGASFQEFAIAAPLFLLLIFALIDVVRYFFLSIVLNYAAYIAVDEASKLPVEIDTTSEGCAQEAARTGVDPCPEYLTSVIERIQKGKAARLVNAVASSTLTGALTRKIEFQHYCSADYPNSALGPNCIVGAQSAIGFLRPGEIIHEAGSSNWYEHPFRSSSATEKAGAGWPSAANSESWDKVLRQDPLVVHIEFEMRSITPGLSRLFGPLRVRATQFAHRRPSQKGVTEPGTIPDGAPSPYIPTVSWTPKSPSDVPPAIPCSELPNPCSSNKDYCINTSSSSEKVDCKRCGAGWGCNKPKKKTGN